MKKFFCILLILLMFITGLTSCTPREYQSTNSPTFPTLTEDSVFPKEKEFSFKEIDLINSYCNNAWDGSFIHNNENCASIKNGELWINCKFSNIIPDMGPNENCFWYHVVGTNENGTWVFDWKVGTIELWNHGTRYQKIYTNFNYNFNTNVYLLSNCIVAQNNSQIYIYSFDGYNIAKSNEIIDCYSKKDGFLLFSNFKHENFEINGKGEIKSLSTHFVRFPRKNLQIKEIPNCCLLPFNNYWYNWDGEFTNINGDFYYVDLYGGIFKNNELIGNINLGISNSITEIGENILTSLNFLFYLNSTDLIMYKKGNSTKINIPDGNAIFLWHDKEFGTVILVYGTENDNKLIIVNDNTVNVISEHVSDAYVAYETIYYMEGDKVYSLDWQNLDAQSKLFFEGAYAVSHRNEFEGAIVPSYDSNMKKHGENNLYSPLGDDSE